MVNYNIIELKSKELPEKLNSIKKPPYKLYAIGNIKLLEKECFGIVGTRKISEYGINNCKNFTREFALRRIPTVSGLALGTDTIVHEETIKYGGETIAVLGSGFDKVFPPENRGLFNRIIENGGLVLSEYSREVESRKNFFPERNRIISALSEGILVIEAAYRSGTTITARNAVQQGKKVFAVPGIIGSTVGEGVNNLIKKGAVLSTSITDILYSYPQFMHKKRINVPQKTFIKNEYRKIYELLKENNLNIEEIIEKVSGDLPSTLELLSEMELENIVCQELNGTYKLLERS